jgi:hypothetical protein
MSPRGNAVSIAAGGVAAAARLLVATLAVTSAYVSATGAFANSAHDSADRLVTQSARSEPTRADAVASSGAVQQGLTTPVSGTGAVPGPGVIAVSAIAGGQDGDVYSTAGCDKVYFARTTITSDGTGVPYGWRLQRWSAAGNKWSAYTSVRRGVAGLPGDVYEISWKARVAANPGWYRFELLNGDDMVQSAKFQVSC